MSERDGSSFVVGAYLRARAVWRGQKPRQTRLRRSEDGEPQTVPFGSGREPRLLGEIFASSVHEMGWTAEVSQVSLFQKWEEFIGAHIAVHTTIVGVDDGVLTVQCDSTAWATELRRLRSEILTRILDEYPESEISELKFLAPGAPSWKHGLRSVRGGRGPRDTYG